MFKFKSLLFNVSLVIFAIIIGAGTIMAVSANDNFVYGGCGGRDYTDFYLDADGDGYGDYEATSTLACKSPDTGYADNNLDCNDSDENINPDASESCNGYDDNCNGGIDEGVKTIFYLDSDYDTYGDLNATTSACTVPDNYVENSDDCDDLDATINPDADEICRDDIDNNCNGNDDELCATTTYYADLDSDGYGNPALYVSSTTQPEGYVLDNTDCNDDHDFMNPGLDEICGDGIDNNCNGNDDEECVFITYYKDADVDGYGDPTDFISATTSPGSDYVLNNDDCDDTDVNINPGEDEICGDDIDNNCNGDDDEECSVLYYEDADGDGYGNPDVSISTTTEPDGYVLDNTDCNDDDANMNPGLDEDTEDGIDNDCDGRVDEKKWDLNDGKCTYNQNEYRNFGQYVSSLAHMTNQWRWQGKISGNEKGQIMSQKNLKIDYSFKYKVNIKQEDLDEVDDNANKGKGHLKNPKADKKNKSKKNK